MASCTGININSTNVVQGLTSPSFSVVTGREDMARNQAVEGCFVVLVGYNSELAGYLTWLVGSTRVGG